LTDDVDMTFSGSAFQILTVTWEGWAADT